MMVMTWFSNMTAEMTFLTNSATAVDIQAHLLGCELGFVHALTRQTDMDAYAQKMAALATRFELWQDAQLVGLLAVYCNQPPQAFITHVSLWPSLQKQGYAAQLMTACIDHVQSLGFKTMLLKVAHSNAKAINFYQRFGFKQVDADRHELTMQFTFEHKTA